MVRSGDGSGWQGLDMDFLAPISLLPVLKPSGSAIRQTPLMIADLSRITLLHSLARPADWATWLRAKGAANQIDSHRGLKFESSTLAYEAALQGSGVAMGVEVLVKGYSYRPDYGLTCRAHSKSVNDRMRPVSAMSLFQASQQASTMARVPLNRRPDR